ncbi:hypothetical protein RB195_016355 [Necator americanus]|uniref:Uncharacterized protein n=1 Tax=Necator americanus TaxID=51031 RepID=A0ABR1E8X6_NECAM
MLERSLCPLDRLKKMRDFVVILHNLHEHLDAILCASACHNKTNFELFMIFPQPIMLLEEMWMGNINNMTCEPKQNHH